MRFYKKDFKIISRIIKKRWYKCFVVGENYFKGDKINLVPQSLVPLTKISAPSECFESTDARK